MIAADLTRSAQAFVFLGSLLFGLLFVDAFVVQQRRLLARRRCDPVRHSDRTSPRKPIWLQSWSRHTYGHGSEQKLLTEYLGTIQLRDRNSGIVSSCDLTSPREWLEWKESVNGGKGGAYTVIRCQFSTEQVQVWGLTYHLQRLWDSIRVLVKAERCDDATIVSEDVVHNAWDSSIRVLQTLLDDANKKFMVLSEKQPYQKGELTPNSYFIVMMTLLWEYKGGSPINVNGHVLSTWSPSNPSSYIGMQNGIQCVLAPGDDVDGLPNRHQAQPSAKLSSWCRQRRPLEEAYKADGVGEVLLTRKMEDDRIEVLEGLTSNIFVVDKDGKLRTPAEGVLEGYARELVLDAATNLGIAVEVGPVFLSELMEAQEVFLTSSIRLIVPVQSVGTVTNGAGVEEQWESKGELRLWETLYVELFPS